MSTKKDGAKVSKTRRVTQISSNLDTMVREYSTDRRNAKKMEDSIEKLKSSTTSIKQKSVDTSRPQPTKSDPRLNSVSGTSSEKNKVKHSDSGSRTRVSKYQFFPNSNALKTCDTDILRMNRTDVNKTGEPATSKVTANSSSRKESNSKRIRDTNNSEIVNHIPSQREEKRLKGETISTRIRSKVNNKPLPHKKTIDSYSISSSNVRKSMKIVRSESDDVSAPTEKKLNPDCGTVSERPSTATLRKGSIVNTNIVGPDVPDELVPKLVKENSMLLKPFEFRSESKSKVRTASKLKTKQSESNKALTSELRTKSTNSSSSFSLRNETNSADLKTVKRPTISKSSCMPDLKIELLNNSMRSKDSPKSDSSQDYDYEDDFNSYESDFEKYSSLSSSLHVDDISGQDTSSISSSESHFCAPEELKSATKRLSSAGTDDEKKMDSGHYDLPDYKHKQILDNIRESVEKENTNLNVQRNNTASLSDEGFEDQKSLQFINFLDAQKKTIRRRSMDIRRKRGEEILSMIKLDTFSYTLFDLAPVPYEVFIKTYGHSNTVQSSTQTGDDNIDEEIQTDEVSTASRWTQFPVCFSKLNPNDSNFWNTYRSEYLGVGSENAVETDLVKKPCNEHYLNKFLLSAATLVAKILEEQCLDNFSSLKNNSRDLPFSDGYISLNTTNDILRGSRVDYIFFSCDNNKKFLTVHTRKDKHVYAIAIWKTYSAEPELILESYSAISSCFGDLRSCFVYGGLYNGTILIWNTSQFSKDDSMHIPVYTTNVGIGHITKVIAIQQLTDFLDDKMFLSVKSTTKEICSLDEDGEIILWGVIMKQHSKPFELDGKEIVLVKNSHVSLKDLHPELSDLMCTDFVLDISNNNYAFISTNYGFIIHYPMKGGKAAVKRFYPGTNSSVTCLEVCPFSSDYLLAGFTNGNINLYSRLVDKPLMMLSDKESSVKNNGIQMIQWSKTRPFVIYIKDFANNIHIWDLNESDIFPIYSIPFQKNVTCMKLSPSVVGCEDSNAFLVLGTDDGSLYMHHLNDEHGHQSKSTYEEHVKTFLSYANRL